MSVNTQSKRWCFTLNNYDEEAETKVKALDSLYLVYGHEVGDSGTPHLQGFVTFKRAIRFNRLRSLLPFGTHIEVTKGTSLQAADYCKKQDKTSFFERGSPPCPGKRTDLDSICESIVAGSSLQEIASEYPATYVRNYRGLAAFQATQVEALERDNVCGIWIHGPPGCGKSHAVREYATKNNMSIFDKPQTKWWDGYAGEEVIMIDDLDHNLLGHYLKRWGDKWSCTGEIKGGTVKLRHKLIFVTSNYSISELYPDKDDHKNILMAKAIERRFPEIQLSKYNRSQHQTFIKEKIKLRNVLQST